MVQRFKVQGSKVQGFGFKVKKQANRLGSWEARKP
jgi:hypothetical protein